MNDRYSCLQKKKGLTLVELLITIVILSIISTGMVVVFKNFNRAILSDNVRVDIRQTLRSGIDFMTREIQQAGFDPTGAADAGIEIAEPRMIRFTRNLWNDSKTIDDKIARENEEQITYAYDDKKRTVCRILYEDIQGDDRPGSSQPLIDDVADCEFSYFGRGGMFLGTNPVDIAAIRSVEIRLRLDKPAALRGNLSGEFRTKVLCRNL